MRNYFNPALIKDLKTRTNRAQPENPHKDSITSFFGVKSTLKYTSLYVY